MTRTALLFISLFVYSTARPDDHYRVQFDARLDAVTVEACFEGPSPKRLYRNSRSHRHTNWIRFNGEGIRARSRSTRLDLPELPDDACISWQVDLADALAERDYRMALRLGDSIVTDGNLWFWRDGTKRPLSVEVSVPEGFSISVPWKGLSGPGDKLLFRPDPTPVWWSSRIAVGRFPLQRIAIGGTELRIAAIGDLDGGQRRELASWIGQNADSVSAVYGQFPRRQPQILIVPIGKQRSAVPWAHVIRGGGVAVELFIDQTRPTDGLREDWTATHELSHLFLPYVSSSDRWLSEGLASYYQNVLRARDGRLTEEQAWQKLHSGFERGRIGTRRGTLAGATRTGSGSTMRIYWSGAAIMLKADTRLRAISGGSQSLDTALYGLQKCCIMSERSWNARELLDELDRITDTRIFSELYHEHVMDESFPDVRAEFERLGLATHAQSLKLEPDAPWGRIRFYIMNG